MLKILSIQTQNSQSLKNPSVSILLKSLFLFTPNYFSNIQTLDQTQRNEFYSRAPLNPLQPFRVEQLRTTADDRNLCPISLFVTRAKWSSRSTVPFLKITILRNPRLSYEITKPKMRNVSEWKKETLRSTKASWLFEGIHVAYSSDTALAMCSNSDDSSTIWAEIEFVVRNKEASIGTASRETMPRLSLANLRCDVRRSAIEFAAALYLAIHAYRASEWNFWSS